jgi:hypothetical protein
VKFNLDNPACLKQERSCSSLWKNIDIRPLKVLVFEKFPQASLVRQVILAERDFLSIYEFLAKIETWLNLLKMIKNE